MPVAPLQPSSLRPRFGADDLPFDTTDALEPLEDPVGQERATEAIRFGIAMESEGYNLFVTGAPGVGRHTLVRAFLEASARSMPVPRDVCYVHDFTRPGKPRPIHLPPGRGRALREAIAQLVRELGTVLPSVFEGEEFTRAKQHIEEDVKERHEARLGEVKAHGEARGVALVSTPMGFAIVPIKHGHPIEPDAFEKLPEAERERYAEAIEATQKEMRQLIDELPRVQSKMRAAVRELIHKTAADAIRHHIEEVRVEWKDEPAVLEYLDAFEADVRENVGDFLKDGDSPEGDVIEGGRGPTRLRRYRVNVIVDHGKTDGAPVVYENHPTYANLVGRIEHVQQFGALLTDFNLIKAGALHRANGGFLLLDARNLLMQPLAWDGLKRALLSRELRLESPEQALGLVSTVSLEPEPVPLSLKVVLVGEREILRLLEAYDADFRMLFKVTADFDDEIVRTKHNALLYARLLAGLVRKEGLLHLGRDAVARVLEETARAAGDANKLTAQVIDAFAAVREGTFFARKRGSSVVETVDVERAIDAQERRAGRIRERVLEEIEHGTLMVDTDGRRVGQVNALSVYVMGRASFGRPSRVTAKVRLGKGEVIDIEREVELGGPIHSKGVLILSSFLASRYACDMPLSLQASIVFEQSYGVVEGDSASCAELCALLSALGEIPIKQSFAMTGSVNQHGEVQAIGGVNEKIEGFFEVCRARGLTGTQGVVIPRANVRHLVLRDEVVRAVESGKFSVWPVSTVDEAMSLLTELPAGERGSDGRFAAGGVNAKVEARLQALADRRLELADAGANKKG